MAPSVGHNMFGVALATYIHMLLACQLNTSRETFSIALVKWKCKYCDAIGKVLMSGATQ